MSDAGAQAPPVLDRADRWLRTLSGALAAVGSLVLVYLMVGTSLDVILRNASGRGLHGVVEYSEIFMAALVFLGLGQAQRTDAHIAVDVFVRRLPRPGGRVVTTLGLVVTVLVLLFLTYATANSAMESFQAGERHYGVAGVPMWPARAAIPVGLAVMALECLLQAVRHWTGWVSTDRVEEQKVTAL